MRVRRIKIAALLAALLLTGLSSTRADTFVSGTISASTTWTLAGSPYVVTGDVYVESSVAPVPVLTMEAGVTVKFNPGRSLIIGSSYPGELQAVGTAASPIILTANTVTPTPGFWRSLRFRPGTTATSKLAYATVSYGGVGYSVYYGALNIESSSPTIQNVTVQSSAYAGIKLVDGSPVISGCTLSGNNWGLVLDGTGAPSVSGSTVSGSTAGAIWVQAPIVPSLTSVAITNNAGFAITQEAKSAYGTVSGVTATGNTVDAVEIRGSVADTSTTWKSFGLPYILTGDVFVEKNGTPVPVLTIAAGVTVKFNSQRSLYIGNSYNGALLAVGTATSRILFTANSATPTPGFWQSLRFRPKSTTSKLEYATVSYGGVDYSLFHGAVHVESDSPTIQNVTFQNNAYAGIGVVDGSPSVSYCTLTGSSWGVVITGASSPNINNSTISGNSAGGIWVQGSASPSLSKLTIADNAGFAISQEARTTFGAVSSLTASGNRTDGVEVRGSTADVSATWKSSGLPYIVTGDVFVEKNGTPVPVLTIAAGVTVKFNSQRSLYIGDSYPGALTAVGTASSPIVFTGNSATPTPGFWQSLRFRPKSTTSKLEHATVSYGGVGYSLFHGAVHVESDSPTIKYVTVQNSAYAGIKVIDGSPTISYCTSTGNGWGIVLAGTGSPDVDNSTISNNTSGGIWIEGTSSPSLSILTISNNAGFAISQEARTTFGAVSSLTASGNRTDGIEVRGSTADVSATWKSSGLPYIVTGDVFVEKNGTPVPVLTIASGVTVKFNAGRSLFIGNGYPGEIQAVGTATATTTFTANAASPVPGSWYGIKLGKGTTPSSRIAYATVSYGGIPGSASGIEVYLSSPTIQNVTLQNNANAGMGVNQATPIVNKLIASGNPWGLVVWNGGSPTVTNSAFSGNSTGGVLVGGTPGTGAPSATFLNCIFAGNPVGLQNSTAVPVLARLNYWSSGTGPSGSGSGSGQSVTAGVKFEPWLVGTPSTPQYFNSSTQKNRAFNPAIGVETTITAAATLAGSWTTTILDSVGATIRTFSGSSFPETVVWDGKSDSGVDMPNGTYSYRLACTAGTGAIATAAQGLALLDRTKQLNISDLALSQPFFSPNGDGVQDTTTVTGTNSFDDTTLTVNVKTSGGSVVRTSSSSGADLSYTWDGKNAAAVVQPDGVYTLEVVAVNGTASATSAITSTLDNTAPTGAFVAPTDGQVLSNVYTNGATNVIVTGSAGDLNFRNWSLDYGSGVVPTSFTILGSGTAAVTNVPMGSWVTAPMANGLYTLRLQVWDKAGNHSVISIRPTVGNFSVSQNAIQLNASGGSIIYSSIVPFNLTETLLLKNAGGQIVRALVNAARPAGTFADIWNGSGDANVVVPDGPYFYFATVTDGTYTFTWDLTSQYLNNYGDYNDRLNIGSWDPFNNRPLTFSYNFAQAGRVNIGLTPQSGLVPANCDPPNICLASEKYEESGPHTVTWAGVDGSGAFRGDIRSIGVVTGRGNFSRNAVVVFGTKPTVANVTVSPAVYGPASGGQTVAFDLATYQNQNVSVTVAFTNQASLSVLRTLSLTGQAPGHRTVAWDGRADNGMWVAPGAYTVTVTAADTLGNIARGQILTTVQY